MTESLFGFSRTSLVEPQGWVTDVLFDNQQELIWVAGQKGYVTSYYSCGLQLYTKFFANDEVKQLLPVDAGILSLSSNRLNLHTRQGLSQHSFTSPHLTRMCCMCSSGGEVLLGGHTKTLTKYDLGKRKVVHELNIGDSGCVIIRETSSLYCLGCPDGDIQLYDKNAHKKISSIPAHSGTISDFDICDNLLVSCGFASRGKDMSMSVKRALLVYDLRMMRSMNAVHCSIDPVQLRFMPMYHSQVLVASQSGQFEQLEVTATIPTNKYLFEVDLGGNYCNAIDLSSTSKALAIGDSAGMLHLLASQEDTAFNSFSQPTYFPQDNSLTFPKVNIDDYSFPLASVPMPYTSERLMSDWPSEFNRSGSRRTKPIDPEILRNMKMVKFVGGYSPNPNNLYKNTIPYELNLLQQREDGKRRDEVAANIPRVYQRVDVDPTSLSESELHNYNRTKFSVLYNTKGNAYICTVLQMLYYLEPIALALKSHICQNSGCLACELGVLFYTLDVTDDKITDSDSFIQMFDQLPAAKFQDWQIFERHVDKKDLLQLPQSLSTFLLRHLHEEIVRPPQPTSSIYLTFGSKVAHRTSCATCHQTWFNKPSINLSYTLDYPRDNGKITFVELLKRTMQAESATRHILCNRCGNYTPCNDKAILESLPYILHLNCGMQPSDVEFWQSQVSQHNDENHRSCPDGRNCNSSHCKLSHGVEQSSWLPLNFHIKAGSEQGALQFARGLSDEKENKKENSTVGVFEYELCSVVAHIDSPKSQGLMLHSLVGRGYHQRQGAAEDNAWYLYNGCSAISTHNKEATNFGQVWKSPCLVVYKQVKLPKDLYNHTTPNPHELFTPFNMIQGVTLVPLTAAESLGKGELVGIGLAVDPAPACLLRVVLVRGQGDDEGVPFSHDICPTNYAPDGHHHVKLLYFKIKCLVDRGLILVGHHITKQLQYLNIHIPAQQYIDTADLFRPANSGAIPPLQFLCPRILNVENVPGAQNDAVFSLQLYEKFLDLKRAGQYEKTLKAIHSE